MHNRFDRPPLGVLLSGVIILQGCEELIRDTQSLLVPSMQRSEVFGLVAGFGTTFAAQRGDRGDLCGGNERCQERKARYP